MWSQTNLKWPSASCHHSKQLECLDCGLLNVAGLSDLVVVVDLEDDYVRQLVTYLHLHANESIPVVDVAVLDLLVHDFHVRHLH